MTGTDPQISGVRSDRSTICAQVDVFSTTRENVILALKVKLSK